jgi:hypothetical protein
MTTAPVGLTVLEAMLHSQEASGAGLPIAVNAEERGRDPFVLPTGLGVYSGNDTEHPAIFASWLGRPAALDLVFFNQTSWVDFASSIPFITDLWAGKSCIWSVPLACQFGTLPYVVAGAHDDKFVACARAVLAAAPPRELIWVRIGWEFNLVDQEQRAFDNDAPKPNAAPGSYVAAYRRVVGIFRNASSRFRFIWCPNAGDETENGLSVSDCYPDDDAVDLIGLDLYFNDAYDSTSDCGLNLWRYRNSQAWGPANTAAFAMTRGKPFGMIEYGINNNTVTQFAEEMFKFIRNPANNCILHNYWDSDAVIDTELSGGGLAAIGALYKRYFGPPVITNQKEVRTAQNSSLDMALTSNQDDIAGLDVTWSVVAGTASIVSGATLRVLGAPAGSVPITVRATNSDGLHSDQSLTVAFAAPR